MIQHAIPGDKAGTEQVAKTIFDRAVLRVGRTPNVDFNREWVTFNFVASKGSYEIGVDIMSAESDIIRAQYLYSTDNTQPIALMDLQRFRDITGGQVASGRPTHATIHSASKTLEVYPTPDSSYEYGLYVQKTITKFSEIPDVYHDVVASTGILMVQALRDPGVAARLQKEDMDALKRDSILGWDGTTIAVERGLDYGGGLGADSMNLRNS